MDIEALNLIISVKTEGLKESLNKVNADFQNLNVNYGKTAKSMSGSSQKMSMDVKQSADKIAMSFESATQRATQSMNRMKGSMTSATGGIRKLLGPLLSMLSIYAIYSNVKNSFNVAQGTYSSFNQLSRLLQENNKSFMEWVKNQAYGYNLSESAAMKYGATYANLLSGFINNSGDLEKYTTEMLKTSAVVANATGRTIEDTADRIRSGLLGSTESIEDLGINTNIALLETTDAFKQFSNGLSWDKLDFQTQQYIRMMAIMEQANRKFGSSLPVNPVLQFQASLQNLQLALGKAFMPIIYTVLPVISRFIQAIAVAVNFISQVVASLTGMFGATNAVGGAVSDMNAGLDGLGSGMDSIGSGLDNLGGTAGTNADKVEKAAKKIKGALLGLDELNLLKRPEDNSSDIGTGDKITAPNISAPTLPNLGQMKVPNFSEPMNQQFIEVSEAAKKAADSIRDTFMRIWHQDDGLFMGNFQRAIEKTKDIISTFRSVLNTPEVDTFVQNMGAMGLNLGSIALNIYNNFVAPLLKWFVGSIPEALRVLNPFIEQVNERLRALANPQTGTQGMDRIIRALDAVKAALLPLTANLGDGLLWIYDNVIKPLGKWIWNERIPRDLILLADILGIINRVIEILKPIWQRFWEVFFKPLAEWTGGIILGVLDALHVLLSKIGDWIDDHQGTVEAFTYIVLGFATAWAVTELAVKGYNVAMNIASGISTFLAQGGIPALVASFNPLMIVLGLVAAAVLYAMTHMDEMPIRAQYAIARLNYNWNEFLLVIQFAVAATMDAISMAVNEAVAFVARKLVGLAEAFYNLTGKGEGALQALKNAADGNLIPVGQRTDELKQKWQDNVDKVTEAEKVFDEKMGALKANTERTLPEAGKNFSNLSYQVEDASNKVNQQFNSMYNEIGKGLPTDYPVRDMDYLSRNVDAQTRDIYGSIFGSYRDSSGVVADYMGNIRSTSENELGNAQTRMGIKNTAINFMMTVAWAGMWATIEQSTANFVTSLGNHMVSIYNHIDNMVNMATGRLNSLANAFGSITINIKAPINDAIYQANVGLVGIANAMISSGYGSYYPFSVRQIQYLAKGGIVDGATPAIIGEAGAEAVVPLENNTGWIDKIAEKFVSKIPGVSSSNGETFRITIQNVLDGNVIGEKTVEYINDRSMLTGRNPITDIN